MHFLGVLPSEKGELQSYKSSKNPQRTGVKECWLYPCNESCCVWQTKIIINFLAITYKHMVLENHGRSFSWGELKKKAIDKKYLPFHCCCYQAVPHFCP